MSDVLFLVRKGIITCEKIKNKTPTGWRVVKRNELHKKITMSENKNLRPDLRATYTTTNHKEALKWAEETRWWLYELAQISFASIGDVED